VGFSPTTPINPASNAHGVLHAGTPCFQLELTRRPRRTIVLAEGSYGECRRLVKRFGLNVDGMAEPIGVGEGDGTRSNRHEGKNVTFVLYSPSCRAPKETDRCP
jgi:hypothetical protein